MTALNLRQLATTAADLFGRFFDQLPRLQATGRRDRSDERGDDDRWSHDA